MEPKHRLVAVTGLLFMSASILLAGERLSHLAEIAGSEFMPEMIEEIPPEDEVASSDPAPQPLQQPPEATQASSPPLPSPATDPANWKLTLLYQPVIASLTEIKAQGHRMMLSGVAPLDSAEQCGAELSRWPCGRFAVTAFRHYVRGRAIRCSVPENPLPDPITTQCYIGKDDLGHWLVANGWATAVDDDAYGAMAQQAIKSGRGRYAPPPR